MWLNEEIYVSAIESIEAMLLARLLQKAFDSGF